MPVEIQHWTLCYVLESLHYRDVHSVCTHWWTHKLTHTDPERCWVRAFFGPKPSVKGFWGNGDDDGVSRQTWQPFRTVQFSMSQEADTQMLPHTNAHTRISEAFMHGQTYWIHIQTHQKEQHSEGKGQVWAKIELWCKKAVSEDYSV